MEGFLKAPTLEALESFTRDTLHQIAKKLNLESVKSHHRKEAIFQAIVEAGGIAQR